MNQTRMRRLTAVIVAVMLLGGCAAPVTEPVTQPPSPKTMPSPETAAVPPTPAVTPGISLTPRPEPTPPPDPIPTPAPEPTPAPTPAPTPVPTPVPAATPEPAPEPFVIDRYILRPDQRARLTDAEQALYRALMDGLIAREDLVDMSGDSDSDERVLYAFRQHPFFFLLEAIEPEDGGARLSYAYTADEHREIIEYMDSEYSAILSSVADMNELERVLAVYQYFGRRVTYDRRWVSNIEDPYQYPHIRVYEALSTNGGVCHSYAYTVYYALLLLGIDCFYQYGESGHSGDPHMWNIVKLDGSFFHIDATWDRAQEADYVGLRYFGRTDAERRTGLRYDFAASHDTEAYGLPVADDKRLSTFGDVIRFEFGSQPHTIILYRRNGTKAVFNTETWMIV